MISGKSQFFVFSDDKNNKIWYDRAKRQFSLEVKNGSGQEKVYGSKDIRAEQKKDNVRRSCRSKEKHRQQCIAVEGGAGAQESGRK